MSTPPTETCSTAPTTASARSEFTSDFGNKFKISADKANVRYTSDSFDSSLFCVFADDFKSFMEEFLQEFN